MPASYRFSLGSLALGARAGASSGSSWSISWAREGDTTIGGFKGRNVRHDANHGCPLVALAGAGVKRAFSHGATDVHDHVIEEVLA